MVGERDACANNDDITYTDFDNNNYHNYYPDDSDDYKFNDNISCNNYSGHNNRISSSTSLDAASFDSDCGGVNNNCGGFSTVTW